MAALAVAVLMIGTATYLYANSIWAHRGAGSLSDDAWSPKLAIDGYERLHILFKTEYGFYYYVIGGDHSYTMSAGTARSSNLVVDDLEHACFAYVLQTVAGTYAVGVYVKDSPVHVVSIADGTDDVSPSIAVDSEGHLHVSYSAGGDLYYATDSSGEWEVTEVLTTPPSDMDSFEWNRWQTVILVDSEDSPHIVYGIYTTEIGHVHRLPDGTWTNETIAEWDGGVPEVTAAIDSDDVIHACYAVTDPLTSSSELVYASNAGGTWTKTSILRSDLVMGMTSLSLALRSSQEPAISFSVPGSYDLDYICMTDGRWTGAERIVKNPLTSECTLCFDSDDRPYIAYASGNGIEYATTSVTFSERLWSALPGISLMVRVVAIPAVLIRYVSRVSEP